MPKPIVLCAINSRYSHSALAVRSLIRYTRENWPEAPPLQLIEETIHEPPLKLLHQLAESGAGVFAFSCYIWNITLVHTLSRQLRQISPQSIIIWGGPEAGSAAGKWLQQESAVDYIIRGEGENSFLLLLKTLDSVQQKTAA